MLAYVIVALIPCHGSSASRVGSNGSPPLFLLAVLVLIRLWPREERKILSQSRIRQVSSLLK